jgi:hypothetical protein
MLWPIGSEVTSAFVLQTREKAADIACMERTRRSYFLLLGLACAVGWSTALWAVPLLAYAVLEVGWTVAERAGAARGATLREVEVERVQ